MCSLPVEQVGSIGPRAAAVGRARRNSAGAAQRVQGATRRRLRLYQRAAQPCGSIRELGRLGPRGHRRRAALRLEGPFQDMLRVRGYWMQLCTQSSCNSQSSCASSEFSSFLEPKDTSFEPFLHTIRWLILLVLSSFRGTNLHFLPSRGSLRKPLSLLVLLE